MQNNKYDIIYGELVVEMFRRVGLEKTYEEIKEFAKEPEWFLKHTWSKKEEDDFVEWAINLLREKLKYSKKQATKQAHWFVFVYGWKTYKE